MSRAWANRDAISVLERLNRESRPATREEQETLAKWSSWGALPKVFDPSDAEFDGVRHWLVEHLSEAEYRAAALTTIDAHYTDPMVVSEMWRGLERLGFSGGRVLEPGCGSGTFIGLAPKDAEMVGVEVDPVSARIAAALYPSASIRNEGFETTRLVEGSFVGAVGNVPFGNVKLHDATFNRHRHAMHNHFIIKSLRLCAPGGMVAVLTSRYTMDAQNPAARREMAELGDLVGAIRLPGGAMRRVAGTDAICDVLVLRRREDGRAPDAEAWMRSVDVDTPAGAVRMNEWFVAHPEMILGELTAGRGMYGDGELMVKGDQERLGGLLATAVDHLVVSGTERGLMFTAGPGDEAGLEARVDPGVVRSARKAKIGSIVETETGFAQLKVDGFVNLKVPVSRVGELRRLLGLRDVTLDLLEAQAAGRPVETIEALRAELNTRYDAYVAVHGPVSRWRWSTPKDPTKEPRKVRPRLGGFREDPDCATVLALEDFDALDQVARKMPIFTRDVLQPVVEHLGADSPGDALAISLSESGGVNLGRVAELLGVDEVEARVALGDLVFEEPDGGLVTAAEYLSGNVREKLMVAEEAAERDGDRWGGNVEALRAVQPRDLVAGEITARPGVAWIPPTDVEAFMVEVLELPPDGVDVTYVPATGEWKANVPVGLRRSPVCTTQYGTAEKDAVTLLNATLNQRPVSVTRTLDNGSRVTLGPETALAKERQAALVERFGEWVFEDPKRRDRLVGEYNRRFNSVVPRHYDGAYLELPGLSRAFEPREHQRAAVARIVAEPTVLLDHAVGAGKTGTMAMAGMEMRRLGLIRQPWYVVPNHMLEQFAAEFKQWYPAANVLVGRDLRASERREFVARTATGEWDAVVVTQSAFSNLGVSDRVLEGYLSRRVGEFEDAMVQLRGSGDDRSVKQVEKAKLRLEQSVKAKINQARKDTGMHFDESGCDYLFVDEAHNYKNLAVPTSVEELSVSGSQRSEDLAMKLEWLREHRGGQSVTFATGTPVANSMRELFVMQKYLRPAELEAAGVQHFDAWAAQFCVEKTTLELAPSGASHRMKTRIAGFVNTPELIGMYRQFADVMLAEDLDLEVPELSGGERIVRIVEPSDQLVAFIEDLGRRAEQVSGRNVTPGEDNMLKITGEGRLAALDPRCVGLEADPAGGKVEAIATEVSRIFEATKDHRYLDAHGEPARTPGGLQIVFCDRSTPKRNDLNFYDELRDRLVEAGIPRGKIRFAQEAGQDQRKKEELFAACRDGQVSVLIGSTERMGVGTNIQARAVALHHADCPWRPADLEQREGRILRQGNQNDEVEILAYATEGSFDVYMWQLVERKARFIGQVRSGDVTARTVDDLGDEAALSYAEFKALASGNPLIMERAEVEADVVRLERLRTMHHSEQARIGNKIGALGRERTRLTGDIATVDRVGPTVTDTRGDRFTATIRGRRFTDRKDAGAALNTELATALADVRLLRSTDEVIGEIGGVGIRLRAEKNWDIAALELVGLPVRRIEQSRQELRNSNPLGLCRQLESRLQSFGDIKERAQERIGEIDRELDGLTQAHGRPFAQSAQLDDAARRLTEIDEELTEMDNADEPDGEEPEQVEVHGQRPTPAAPNPTLANAAEPPAGIVPTRYSAGMARQP